MERTGPDGARQRLVRFEDCADRLGVRGSKNTDKPLAVRHQVAPEARHPVEVETLAFRVHSPNVLRSHRQGKLTFDDDMFHAEKLS
jgi:hypothetical protein